MILRRISLTTKLGKLEALAKTLQNLQKKVDKKKFLSDEIIQKAIERLLQQAIEAVLDISDHIISDKGLKKGQDYKDSILILGEHRILPQKFADHLAKAAGFRNILVHDYIDLDTEKVFQHFKEDIKDLQIFLKHIAEFTNL